MSKSDIVQSKKSKKRKLGVQSSISRRKQSQVSEKFATLLKMITYVPYSPLFKLEAKEAIMIRASFIASD